MPMRQNRLQIKTVKETKRTLYNKTINSPKRWQLNIYTPNFRGPKYMKQTLAGLKKNIDKNMTLVAHFSSPLSIMDRTATQRINKTTDNLNSTIGSWT